MPDPERLVQAYHQSASTLNLLRAFTKGGFADLVPGARVDAGVRGHAAPRAGATRRSPTRSSGRCASCGPAASTSSARPQLHEVDVYTSHEALLLGYEEALTRQDSLTGDWYDCSAHMLWIGERTRQLDGAHVEFLRGVGNPLGVQARARPPRADEVLELCEALNPARVPGRLTLITRMGADQVEDALRPLLAGRARRRPSGRVGLRPDARQHLHVGRAAARPATSRTSCAEIGRLRPRPPRRGHVARRRPRRAHRRRRHRVPRRRRGHRSTRTRRPLRDLCDPGSTPASRSTSPSAWPSSSEVREPVDRGGAAPRRRLAGRRTSAAVVVGPDGAAGRAR